MVRCDHPKNNKWFRNIDTPTDYTDEELAVLGDMDLDAVTVPKIRLPHMIRAAAAEYEITSPQLKNAYK